MTATSSRTCALLSFAIAVALCGPVPSQAKDDAGEIVNPQTLKFTPIPNMPACSAAAIVRGNPRSGPAWVYLKLDSGCRVPQHWHTANEDLVIISGTGSIEMENGQRLEFAPGAYASLPSHHFHHANCTRTCMIFAIADAAFDIHYVDANGQEISMDEALKQLLPTPKSKPKKNKKKK